MRGPEVSWAHPSRARYVSFFSGGPGTGNAWGYSYNLGWHVTRVEADRNRKQNYLCPMRGVNSDNSDKWSMEFSCSQLTRRGGDDPQKLAQWSASLCQWEASIVRSWPMAREETRSTLMSLNHQSIQEWSVFGRFKLKTGIIFSMFRQNDVRYVSI